MQNFNEYQINESTKKRVKVINKGYTITVTSWENDGDYSKTKSKTVKTENEARDIVKICKELFVSCNNRNSPGIGNSADREADETIKEYIEDNPELNLTYDIIQELAWELMGSSEFYDFRVCERVRVTYSPDDIYLEEITF